MLLSPRPSPLLPSTVMGEYAGINKVDRASYMPQVDGNNVQSPRSITVGVTSASTLPKPGALAESPRRRSPKRSTSNQKTVSVINRADSATSVRSRGSTTSMNRSLSRDSTWSSLKRSMSRDSTTSKKPPKLFVVKSKASKVLHRRPSSSTLDRTPSYGKITPLGGLVPLTQTELPKRERRKTDSMQLSDRPLLTADHLVKQKGQGLTQHGDSLSPPLIRRALSDGNSSRLRVRPLTTGAPFRGLLSENNPTMLTQPRRSSNLAREAQLTIPTTMQASEFSSDSDSDSDADSNDEQLEIPVRRPPLLEEPEPSLSIRKITERCPPPPPTLQLRRPSASSTSMSPRAGIVSGLSVVANNSLQFAQPGPGPVAPPCVTTTSAVVTDLPYAPLTVGSASSVKERINLLQQGQLSDEGPLQSDPVDTPPDASSSATEERMSTATTVSGTKAVSLENTRYALSPEAHMMIRRLSNGPPGMLRRPQSPSPPPPMPSGWTRSERTTRTMQKQVMYRDLEQEASEQQLGLFSPMIARPDSRTDYFNPAPSHSPTTSVENDQFLNTYGRLNQELRRINKELSNIKKFSDPVGDALQRLAERRGTQSPRIPASIPSKASGSSMFSLSSSIMRRFSPERRDGALDSSLQKSSLPSRLRESPPSAAVEGQEDRQDGGVEVFGGEQESKFREMTRQLWFSLPEHSHGGQRSRTSGETEPEDDNSNNRNDNGRSKSPQREGGSAGTEVSPTDMRNSSGNPTTGERRGFGSGLRQTWGSALALAGLRS